MSSKKSQDLFEVFREAARKKNSGVTTPSFRPEDKSDKAEDPDAPTSADVEESHLLNISYEHAITGLLVIIALLVMSYVVGHKIGFKKGAKEGKAEKKQQQQKKQQPAKTDENE